MIDRPNSPQSVLLFGRVLPLSGKVPEALGLANEVIGSGFLSRLNLNLREDKGWSYGIRSGLPTVAGPARAGGLHAGPVGPDRGFDPPDPRRHGGVRDRKGVDATELQRVTDGNIRGLPNSFQTNSQVLGALLDNQLLGRPDTYQASLPEIYRAIDAAQIDAAARQYLAPDDLAIVVVGDRKQIDGQLATLGMEIEYLERRGPVGSCPVAPPGITRVRCGHEIGHDLPAMQTSALAGCSRASRPGPAGLRGAGADCPSAAPSEDGDSAARRSRSSRCRACDRFELNGDAARPHRRCRSAAPGPGRAPPAALARFSIFRDIVADERFEDTRAANCAGWPRRPTRRAISTCSSRGWTMRRPRSRDARERACARATKVLASARARRLMRELVDWIANGVWLERAQSGATRPRPNSPPPRSTASAARSGRRADTCVRSTTRTCTSCGSRRRSCVTRPSSSRSLFPADGAAAPGRFVEAMRALQDRLGELQDAAVAPALLERLQIPPRELAESARPEAAHRSRRRAARPGARPQAVLALTPDTSARRALFLNPPIC